MTNPEATPPPAATPPPPPPPAPPTTPAKLAASSVLGDAGYDRLIELLNAPPVSVPGLPPPPTGVPEDLAGWLRAFKEPLVYMTVEAATSAVQAKVSGYSRGRLKELYAQMSPEQIQAVMQGNAAILKKFADQRVNEAAMISSISTRITEASAAFLLRTLAFI